MSKVIHSSRLNMVHFLRALMEEVLPLKEWEKKTNNVKKNQHILVAGLFFLSVHGSCAKVLGDGNARYSWRAD